MLIALIISVALNVVFAGVFFYAIGKVGDEALLPW